MEFTQLLMFQFNQLLHVGIVSSTLHHLNACLKKHLIKPVTKVFLSIVFPAKLRSQYSSIPFGSEYHRKTTTFRSSTQFGVQGLILSSYFEEFVISIFEQCKHCRYSFLDVFSNIARGKAPL